MDSIFDWLRLGLDMISLFIIIGMAIYGTRLLIAMRGILERSWRFISIGSVFLAAGVATFAIQAVTESVIALYAHYVGSVLMIIGGSSMLLGLRSQFHIWVPRRALARNKEKLKDLS